MRINSAERAKGSLAMFGSRGLVDPKVSLNKKTPKGKLVNIPAPLAFCPGLKFQGMPGMVANMLLSIILWRAVMTRSRRKEGSPPQGIR